MKDRFKEIDEARKLLNLPEAASMETIKANYKKMIAKWHPDKSLENKEECAEMTRRIIAAHEVILDYCQNYQFSFSQESVKRHKTKEEWWFDRFGHDPLWGKQ